MSSRKDKTRVCGYICSEFIHWGFCRTLMRTAFFLFVYHTTTILAKLSTWCFEHSGDISCSLIVDPSHTDEFWEGWNTCLWIYIYSYSCWFYTKTAVSYLILITYLVFGMQRTVLSYGSQPSKISCIVFGDNFFFINDEGEN